MLFYTHNINKQEENIIASIDSKENDVDLIIINFVLWNGSKNPQIMQMLEGFSIYRLAGMIGMVGITLTKEQLLKVNKKLNRVKKASRK